MVKHVALQLFMKSLYVLVYKCNDWSNKMTRCTISPYNWTITAFD